ncbi:flagellar biosynthesis repressor FlbT [Devosia naphthalenivorans]|uniref:flagellar biosynthesis repressor FlbT n=1 Tax=Devosia naphthalenivorans TaxID=2082392 RepID=UPI000D37DEC8|nr:flagellar biosynthesis repressor FlbT [Devosia naphthalenivorans]
MPLRLNVKPGERIFLGTSSFVIDNDGTIGVAIEGNLPLLRESDYLWPTAATTPLRRFYCSLQDNYLSGKADEAALAKTSNELLDNGFAPEKLAPVSLAILSGELFKALKAARKLLVEEENAENWADIVRYEPQGFIK